MKRVIGKKPSMIAPISMMMQAKKQVESLEASLTEMETVFSSLAHIDALKIFETAKVGIRSSTQAIKDMDLTPKRYYTYLKSLIDVGLIDKIDGVYQHTTLGKIGYKLGTAFNNAINQRDRLDLADRLCKAKNITTEETEEIMHALLKDTNIAPGERIIDFLGPVQLADTWEKAVHTMVENIENAEEEIYFATQSLEMEIIEALFRAAKRGIKMKFLIGEEENPIKAHHRNLNLLFESASSLNLEVKSMQLPYAFLVVDGKHSIIEVAKPLTGNFSLAFFIRNERVSKGLIESFNILWDKGSEVRLVANLPK